MKLGALNPFRFRALLPGVLAVGLLLGIWLGDLFKGFGWGPGDGPSPGKTSTLDVTHSEGDKVADPVGVRAPNIPAEATTAENLDHALPVRREVVRVLIDDRNYFLVQGADRKAIRLEALIELISKTEPNEDGLRAIIDRTVNSRPTTEEGLRKGLEEAGIPEYAVYRPIRAVKD